MTFGKSQANASVWYYHLKKKLLFICFILLEGKYDSHIEAGILQLKIDKRWNVKNKQREVKSSHSPYKSNGLKSSLKNFHKYFFKTPDHLKKNTIPIVNDVISEKLIKQNILKLNLSLFFKLKEVETKHRFKRTAPRLLTSSLNRSQYRHMYFHSAELRSTLSALWWKWRSRCDLWSRICVTEVRTHAANEWNATLKND